ncbi:phage major tail protein, TP901-1 family [Sporosarcina sp. E16_3]|uniref:phage major tail protein, TP901-1 family n=1 Tax=Sporosarcina sp. E16_3 TaxID=2789293 RepID=UPI001A934A72|nr:phage major tail protein, TP901-1 family [Sporosarcina sp. E16_3]MBO0602699.1 phage major tail protein, TP901-1 family [Sporosarcina sp. E16_3]
MAIEYRGEEKIFAVEIPDLLETVKVIRPFNQTGGSKEISADSIELDTKDRTGSDYGKVTESVSLEGILTEGDEFIDFIIEAIRKKKFVKIYEINTRDLKAEHGLYMVSSFNREYGNGDFATYSLDATLNGAVTAETLTELPDGAE